MLLYGMGNASYGMIARLFGVSEVSVWKRIRKEAAALPAPTMPGEIESCNSTRCGISSMEKDKCWVWKTFDPFDRRALAWVLGDRDDANCRKLLAKVSVEGQIFLIDDWEDYRRCIFEAKIHTGKCI